MSQIFAITMPRWGLTMEEGTLTDWLAPLDGKVEKGSEVVEAESTKLAGTVEAPADGVVRRQIVRPGQTVPVGALLGVVAEPGVDESEIDAFVRSFTPIELSDDEGAGTGPQQIEVDGLTINYLRSGEGPRSVVLLHGFGGDANGWGMVQEPLAAAADTIALDLPGHGGSTKTVADGSLTAQAAFVGRVLDALGTDKVHLVGHSMGAGIALAFAIANPARTASLTLLAPAGLGPEINDAYLTGFIAAERRRDVENVLRTLFADKSLVSRALAEDVVKYKRLDGVAQALKTLHEGMVRDGAQSTDLRMGLQALAVPVTVIWGEADEVIPPAQARGLGDKITLISLPDVGHMPHVEAADRVVSAIKAALATS